MLANVRADRFPVLFRRRASPGSFTSSEALRLFKAHAHEQLETSNMAAPYNSLSSLMKSQSAATLRSLDKSASMSSITSNAAKWDEHVAMTVRRNERIRMQSEATKLRGSFVHEDPRMDGVIPKFKVKACLKAGGVELPEEELKDIMHRFISSNGQFSWLLFCKSLETGDMPSSKFHPRQSSRPTTVGNLDESRSSISSKFLAARQSRKMIGMESSASLLNPPTLSHGKSSEKLRRMVSEASLGAAAIKNRLETTASWHAKMDGGRAATAVPLKSSKSLQALPEEFYQPEEAKQQYTSLSPKKSGMTKEEKFQAEKELKEIMAMAKTGLNSRFSDMFKAFQYIDTDRSGRLSKKEIARALDLWNIPLSDAKLDKMMAGCDQDDDGGISYEEFVDALAADTVSNAAMGKRGLQSKEAMGVGAQDFLDPTKVKKFNISINSTN